MNISQNSFDQSDHEVGDFSLVHTQAFLCSADKRDTTGRLGGQLTLLQCTYVIFDGKNLKTIPRIHDQLFSHKISCLPK